MKQFQEMIKHVLATGSQRPDRTGKGTVSVFGYETRFDISGANLPMVTTKHTSFKNILVELLWFLKADTNVKFLHDHGVHIWDEWADVNGDIGPMYGKQWIDWNGEGINQLQDVIDTLRTDPTSRRLCVTAWNPSVLPTEWVPSENPAKGKGSLAPCHSFFQFYADFVDYEVFIKRLEASNKVIKTVEPGELPGFEHYRIYEDTANPAAAVYHISVNEEVYRKVIATSTTIFSKCLGHDFYMSMFKLSCKLTQR